MKKQITLLALSTFCLGTCFADWGEDLQTVDHVKHWHMDDRIVYVKGEIAHIIDAEGFMLKDDTGEIRVHCGSHELREFKFHPGMRVEVRGRVAREHHHFDLEATAVKLHDGVVVGH